MGSNMMINYLYRDASNYKQFGLRVLTNPTGIAPDLLWAAFRQGFRCFQLFPDIVHFDPAALGWGALFFPDHDTEADDISLHELVSIESTSEQADRDEYVDDLLRRLAALPASRGLS